MRRNSLKVSREIGAGRCNVVSILESCICLHGVPEFHKVLSWEGSQKSWDHRRVWERWSCETTELKFRFFPDETQTTLGVWSREEGPNTMVSLWVLGLTSAAEGEIWRYCHATSHKNIWGRISADYDKLIPGRSQGPSRDHTEAQGVLVIMAFDY